MERSGKLFLKTMVSLLAHSQSHIRFLALSCNGLNLIETKIFSPCSWSCNSSLIVSYPKFLFSSGLFHNQITIFILLFQGKGLSMIWTRPQKKSLKLSVLKERNYDLFFPRCCSDTILTKMVYGFLNVEAFFSVFPPLNFQIRNGIN